MSRIRSLLESLSASKNEPLTETSVNFEGDKVIITKNNGDTEEFTPVGMTAEEVSDKFHGIFKHSEGKAWQWLKKIKAKSTMSEGFIKVVKGQHMCSKDGEEWEECSAEEFSELKDGGYEELENDIRLLYVVTKDEDGKEVGNYMEYDANEMTEEEFIEVLKDDERVLRVYSSVTNSGPIDLKWERPITEAVNDTTECPYHNLLADLLNKENTTVQEYEAAIIKINEAPDIPDEKKALIIEILNHNKDEELEHVRTLQKADDILADKVQPTQEPQGEPTPGGEPEPESNIDVTVDEYQPIKEAISSEDEVFKLLKDREFKDFEEVETLFKEKSYEVTDVYREGDGFNLNLRKDGIEYFVPFSSIQDKFVAVLDGSAATGELGETIAAKVGKLVEKDEYKEFIEILKKGGATWKT